MEHVELVNKGVFVHSAKHCSYNSRCVGLCLYPLCTSGRKFCQILSKNKISLWLLGDKVKKVNTFAGQGIHQPRHKSQILSYISMLLHVCKNPILPVDVHLSWNTPRGMFI